MRHSERQGWLSRVRGWIGSGGRWQGNAVDEAHQRAGEAGFPGRRALSTRRAYYLPSRRSLARFLMFALAAAAAFLLVVLLISAIGEILD